MISDDPRFREGIRLFNAGDYLEASECFEDLFFEGVRDEPEFVRIFLQFAVGIHHVEMRQIRPATERIEEGLRLVPLTRDDRRVDLVLLAKGMRSGLAALRAGRRPEWPTIDFRA